jgi:hypothetical protein
MWFSSGFRKWALSTSIPLAFRHSTTCGRGPLKTGFGVPSSRLAEPHTTLFRGLLKKEPGYGGSLVERIAIRFCFYGIATVIFRTTLPCGPVKR